MWSWSLAATNIVTANPRATIENNVARQFTRWNAAERLVYMRGTMVNVDGKIASSDISEKPVAGTDQIGDARECISPTGTKTRARRRPGVRTGDQS